MECILLPKSDELGGQGSPSVSTGAMLHNYVSCCLERSAVGFTARVSQACCEASALQLSPLCYQGFTFESLTVTVR